LVCEVYYSSTQFVDLITGVDSWQITIATVFIIWHCACGNTWHCA
jgi:hypothetical protein